MANQPRPPRDNNWRIYFFTVRSLQWRKIPIRIEDRHCLTMSQKPLGVTSTFAVLWAFIAVACHGRSLHSAAVLFSMAHLLGCVG